MKWIPSCLRYSNLLTVCTTTVVIAASVSVSLVTIPRDIRPRIQSQISGKGSRAQRPELRNKRIYIPSVQGVKREDLELKLNSISCPCQECVDICLHQISHHYLFRMKPTRCTLLLSTFISTSLHVSGNYVPIIRRNYCIYATLKGAHYFLVYLFKLLYMFRATMCPSSGELTVSMPPIQSVAQIQ